MTLSSGDVFRKHFSEDMLQEVIDLHLNDGVARGVDGTHYEGFIARRDQEVRLISQRALNGSYKFSPYRQKLIIKSANSVPRQVSIPTLRDRVALRALNDFISEIFHDCRPQHSHPIISSVLKSVAGMRADDCFIKLDIQSFYDAVNHEILQKALRGRIRSNNPIFMISSALRNPTGTSVKSRERNELGIPQGLSISNILSSIYLKTIDERYGRMLGVSYHRYVDDILCISEKLEAEHLAEDLMKRLKREKKLICHPLGSGKSTICEPGKSVLYLGYSIGGGKITVRPETEKKLMTSIMEIIFGATVQTLDRAIWRVNLRISGCKLFGTTVGWIFYFSQIDHVSLLTKMDVQIRRAAEKKFGSVAAARLKRLVKAYHQAKYDRQDSGYFPNFDTYSREQKISHLEMIAPGKFKNLEKKSDQQISKIFGASVWREVKRMERDTLGSFS
jgi:RNA-directed DNA polymerase